jgi:2-haloacid dehalogenase|tara:strand:- start:2030 stop:2710 length:681 start_codon:yes stop_codon:yes gene_type:complete
MNDFANIKALAFDHYGTLFDKDDVAKVIDEDFPGHGDEMAQLWFKTIKKYCWLSGLMERYLTWDDITRRALTFAGKSLSLQVTDDLHGKLIQADLILPPYAEVPAALERLAGKLDLYVLTMASPWMVEASQKNVGVDHLFKKVISSEPHGVYKPGNKSYDLGVSEIGLPKEQIGFVSGNSFDVMGGANYGFPTFWLNRKGLPLDELGPQPDWTGKGLDELASLLGT